MGDETITVIVKVLTAIIGVAIVAVLVSQKANTANVLKAGGGAFSSILNAALGPIGNNGLGFSTSLFSDGSGVDLSLGGGGIRIGGGRSPVG